MDTFLLVANNSARNPYLARFLMERAPPDIGVIDLLVPATPQTRWWLHTDSPERARVAAVRAAADASRYLTRKGLAIGHCQVGPPSIADALCNVLRETGFYRAVFLSFLRCECASWFLEEPSLEHVCADLPIVRVTEQISLLTIAD